MYRNELDHTLAAKAPLVKYKTKSCSKLSKWCKHASLTRSFLIWQMYWGTYQLSRHTSTSWSKKCLKSSSQVSL